MQGALLKQTLKVYKRTNNVTVVEQSTFQHFQTPSVTPCAKGLYASSEICVAGKYSFTSYSVHSRFHANRQILHAAHQILAQNRSRKLKIVRKIFCELSLCTVTSPNFIFCFCVVHQVRTGRCVYSVYQQLSTCQNGRSFC